MKKVLCVFGTRPEAIKMAPVVHALKERSPHVQPIVCVTGQHREMLDQVLDLFEIVPDIDLDLMEPNQTLASLSAKALRALDRVLLKLKPEVVLVQGDTTTAMIGALAAHYRKVPVGHVEAGLRTDDRYDPFPEEMNRRLISQLSTYHFAPTLTSEERLLTEGHARESVFRTGNTVVDALQAITAREQTVDLPVDLNGHRLLLVTAHRRENFDEPLQHICSGLRRIADRHEDIKIVYPVHLNPNVKGPVHDLLSQHNRIHLIPPVAYIDLIHLLRASYIVLTDSGGIQEEAPALGKPVLVMRRTTERPEGVEAGVAKLVGTDTETIVRETTLLLEDEGEYNKMAKAVSPYGDGNAAERIVDAILR